MKAASGEPGFLMRFLSRISVRLLAFNLLLVFLPAAGVLLLDTYEQHLLEAQERTMSQEGRLLAAALGATGRLDAADAKAILQQLGQRQIARLRVVDPNGQVLADTSRLGPRREPGPADAETLSQSDRDRLLYRLFSLPIRVVRLFSGGDRAADPASESSSVSPLPQRALSDALAGRYGAATRVHRENGRRTVWLHIAIPIRIQGAVVGVVMVSQSTSRVMTALYAVRLDVAMVVLISLAVALSISLLLGFTIARPLARLRRRSEEILDRRGRLTGAFEPSTRRDEIGDLERALAELTRQLEDHLKATESLASDLSHEFKNPLASIRAATEVALEETDRTVRTRLLGNIQHEVHRLERLLSGAREISRIDALLGEEEREDVPLDRLIEGVVEAFRLRCGDGGPEIRLRGPGSPITVSASSDRLQQVFENLLANAVSFSPPASIVEVDVTVEHLAAEVHVRDRGPGIPEKHLERIFSRFFSYRTETETKTPGDHMGLGLAIARAIVEAYGGSVRAENRSGGGASFHVRLPLTGST